MTSLTFSIFHTSISHLSNSVIAFLSRSHLSRPLPIFSWLINCLFVYQLSRIRFLLLLFPLFPPFFFLFFLYFFFLYFFFFFILFFSFYFGSSSCSSFSSPCPFPFHSPLPRFHSPSLRKPQFPTDFMSFLRELLLKFKLCESP